MSSNSTASAPITVQILDKEYRIACPEGEEETLRASAQFLNDRINQVRSGGKAIGTDRVAIMAALNLAHEFLSHQNEQEQYAKHVNKKVRNLHDRIDRAIQSTQQLEL
jgi:cell division protein ZapA